MPANKASHMYYKKIKIIITYFHFLFSNYDDEDILVTDSASRTSIARLCSLARNRDLCQHISLKGNNRENKYSYCMHCETLQIF
jgi:hypothetical protein